VLVAEWFPLICRLLSLLWGFARRFENVTGARRNDLDHFQGWWCWSGCSLADERFACHRVMAATRAARAGFPATGPRDSARFYQCDRCLALDMGMSERQQPTT